MPIAGAHHHQTHCPGNIMRNESASRRRTLSWGCMPVPLLTLLAVALPSLAGAAESVEELIRRQSREFTDASGSGNTAVLDRYLDDRVVFMGEDGSIGKKKKNQEGTSPTPPGISR